MSDESLADRVASLLEHELDAAEKFLETESNSSLSIGVVWAETIAQLSEAYSVLLELEPEEEEAVEQAPTVEAFHDPGATQIVTAPANPGNGA